MRWRTSLSKGTKSFDKRHGQLKQSCTAKRLHLILASNDQDLLETRRKSASVH